MNKNAKFKKFLNRILEFIPGTLAWLTISFPFWGGFFFPEFTAYVIITFNVFWLYKAISSLLFFAIGFFRIREGENTNWLIKLKMTKNILQSIEFLKREKADLQNRTTQSNIKLLSGSSSRNGRKRKLPQFNKAFQKIFAKLEKRKALRYLSREIRNFEKLDQDKILNWKDIRHVVIIPFAMEPYKVLEPIMGKLSQQTFPTKRINVVLASEGRCPQGKTVAEKLKKKYGEYFENLWITVHDITPNEIIGKGSNMACAGRHVQQKAKELNWDLDKLTVTSCDCDSQFDEQYFSYLTYLFITEEERYYKFFHAPMVYYANIWRVPFFGRVSNTLFTINNIGKSVREDKNIQVSTYSASYKLIKDIGFWSVDVIPEDFHMFLKAMFVYGDKVSVKPIYLTTLSDAAESTSFLKTFRNQYEQVKRWAWGVSDDMWMVKCWIRSKTKSVYTLYRILHIMFDNALWSTNSFILLLGANIPPLINKRFAMTVLGQKLPQLSSTILTLTSVAFVFSLIFDYFLKPPRPGKVNIFKVLLEQLQWFTIPVIGLILGAVPGLDSQTRLLFGKRLEYWVTEKH